MAQNKRQKMDLGAACSSVDGGEPHIAQQIAVANDRVDSGCTNENEEKTIFNENLDEFREAVKWTGFVDRSKLIKELLSKTKDTIVMIFAPKRFGKSMNVSMVKRFLEIERGRNVINAPQDLKELEDFENFKAFKRYGMKNPCQILYETDLVKEHFGRHPVVHLIFKDVDVSSIQKVENSVKKVIHFAYLAHFYHQDGKIFSNGEDDEVVDEYCKIWCDPEEFINQDAQLGLENLIEYLHDYHKRKVYLLVDEVDAPVVDALLAGKSGDEVEKISDEVTELLGAVLKGQVADQHLLGSLVTGVNYLGRVGISEPLNNVPVYRWLLDNRGRFAPYYGLNDEELITLLKNVFPEDDDKRKTIQNEVKEFYSGYNIQNQSVYCLWSVLHYIKQRSTLDASKITEKSFWGRPSLISQMGPLLKNSEFLNHIIELMDITGDGNICVSPRKRLNARVLSSFLNDYTCFGQYSIDVFLFLTEQGYLTSVPSATRNNASIRVKIPNVDVLGAFQQMIKDFCVRICGLDDMEMWECAKIFTNLPKERSDEIFMQKLGEFYNHLRPLLRKFNGVKNINKDSLQVALYTTMLKAGFEDTLMEKIVDESSTFDGIGNLWFHDTFLGILELKVIESDSDDLCKKSAGQALEKILTGRKYFFKEVMPHVKILDLDKYSGVKNYVLLGLCMNGKGKPYMCCLVNSKNREDCFTFPKED